MNMSEIKNNFIKIGEFTKDITSNKKMLSCIWCVDSNILLKKDSRVYIFTSNGEIKKIGGSSSKNGIKSTISFYTSANTGKPSLSRFATMMEIIKEIEKGKKVEIFIKFIENVTVKIEGLYSKKIIEANISHIDLENICKNDFYEIEKKYPEWNKQENHEKWDEEIEKNYIKYRKRSGN